MDSEYLNSLFAKLNSLTRKCLDESLSLAFNRTNYAVEVEHWLIAMLGEPGSQIVSICREFDVNIEMALVELTRRLDGYRQGCVETPSLNPRLFDIIKESWGIASIDFSEKNISTGHVSLALGREEFRGILNGTGLELIDFGAVKRSLREIAAESEEGNEVAQASVSQSGSESVGESALAQFTTDLTQQARDGEIDAIVGRDAEIREIVDILLRRRQNNPILTGEAGVGKTAVVEGFALRIAKSDVPEKLKGVSLLSLDLAALQAGAGVKGEFERRVKAVMDEVKGSPVPVILFIDEAHNMIGAGGAAGQGDVANLIKPALARGELRTIAATTWSEYKKFIEKDDALKRRFQVVKIAEPDVEKAVQMMLAIAPGFEKHHEVVILSDAMRACVEYSDRYLSDRQLPDKAVSVLDTTCARIALSQSATPPLVEDADRRISNLEISKQIYEREMRMGMDHQAVISEINEQLVQAKSNHAELETRWHKEVDLVSAIRNARKEVLENSTGNDTALSTLREKEAELMEVQGDTPLVFAAVNGDAVAETIERWTGIPVGQMVAEEIHTVLNLKDRLEESIIGQSHALEAIAKNILTWRGEMHDPNRPAGVFLLCGTSGVGKTETALTLARLLFGSHDSLVTIEMSQLKSVEMAQTKLFGASAGFVGYGEGGLLDIIRRKPYCVLLLDEFEKANEFVQHLFYNIFDRGFAQDSDGEEIDFRNTITLITTNAATDFIMNLCSDPETIPSAEGFKEAVFPVLLEHFEPAFLGRINGIVPYYPLKQEVIAKIVDLKLGKVTKRAFLRYGASLSFSPEVSQALTERCTEAETGARNVDHILAKSILPDVSAKFLSAIASDRKIEALTVSVGEGGKFEFHEG